MLHQLLIPAAIPHFLNIHCPDDIMGADRLFWRHGKHGHFSIKSAYNKLCEPNWNPHNSKWLLIWRLPVLECVRHFLWLSVNDILLSNLGRYHRSFTADPSCSVYGASEESCLHILHDYLITRELWATLLQRQ
ncbi:hypothetical protein V6N11_055725 [Hibiscus sabdariffa]|uniref:Uncharacterized protein n=2 Tax=Hibiscus sabdariffa TaxID=183260 RepID=A0ABR2NHA9_9ROSI